MATFFQLQPPTWAGHNISLSRPLLGQRGRPDPSMPWISVATGAPGGKHELLQLDKLAPREAHARLAEAYEGLANGPTEWIEHRGLFGGLKSLELRAPNLQSAEHAINPGTALAAQAMFRTDSVLALLPARDRLELFPFHVPLFASLVRRAAKEYAAAQRTGTELCPVPLWFQGRRLFGYLPSDGGTCSHGSTADFNFPDHDQVLRAIYDNPERQWTTRDIDIAVGFPPLDALRVLVAHELIEKTEAGHWRIRRRPTRVLHTGQRLHRLAVELPAMNQWTDTGILPDALGTRPLLCGMSTRMLWNCESDPGVVPKPIVLLRHVPDPACASPHPTFGYEGASDDVPITPSMQQVELDPSRSIRFPATPGRIEARVGGATGAHALYACAGTYRLELLTRIAGEHDCPLRADRVSLVVGSDDFPALPRLPEIREPVQWHRMV